MKDFCTHKIVITDADGATREEHQYENIDFLDLCRGQIVDAAQPGDTITFYRWDTGAGWVTYETEEVSA